MFNGAFCKIGLHYNRAIDKCHVAGICSFKTIVMLIKYQNKNALETLFKLLHFSSLILKKCTVMEHIMISALTKSYTITSSPKRHNILPARPRQWLARPRLRHACVSRPASPASGMASRATTTRRADRFSSSCFSNSCFTEFCLTFAEHVVRSGSTSRSSPAGVGTRSVRGSSSRQPATGGRQWGRGLKWQSLPPV